MMLLTMLVSFCACCMKTVVDMKFLQQGFHGSNFDIFCPLIFVSYDDPCRRQISGDTFLDNLHQGHVLAIICLSFLFLFLFCC